QAQRPVGTGDRAGTVPGEPGGREDRRGLPRHLCSASGAAGISETIRVTSVVDRFLEHSRLYYFGNGGDPQVYIGSADWMDRNLSRRVEVVFPIEVPELKRRLIDVLNISLADNTRSRELLPDGSYRRVSPAPG